jgi:hypothetical protein
MNILIVLIICAALFGAIGQYIDKKLVNMGISKKDQHLNKLLV